MRTYFIALSALAFAACDGGNVTTTVDVEQTQNVNTGSEEKCKLLCIGAGDVVQVTEVCDGEVTSVTEVPLNLIPANCESAPSTGSPAPAAEPDPVETPSPTLAEPDPVFE